jgi:hypothetical protein
MSRRAYVQKRADCVEGHLIFPVAHSSRKTVYQLDIHFNVQLHRPGRAGGGAAGKREIFADRFANDLGAGVEQAGDDRRIEFRNKSFEHRSAVGQRNAGECVRIFHRDFLARKLASAGALDARFRDPGAVFIFVTLGPVIGAARIDFIKPFGDGYRLLVALPDDVPEVK